MVDAAPDSKITVPGGLKINKKVAVGIGVAAVAIFIYMYYRQKQQNAQSTTTQAGQIDPQTGYVYGSAEDQAALAAQSGQTLPTYDSASSVGGQVIGYDQYGQPVYGGGGGGPGYGAGYPIGPGTYTSNAQWSQAAEQYMGSTGADAIAAALGKYITGQPVTDAQVTLIQEAIAAEGYPPVGGPGGFPPSYKTASAPPPVQNGSKVVVPNVIGERVTPAIDKLHAAGLRTHEPPRGNHPYIVTSESPRAGTKVAKGSIVSLGIKIGK